MDDTYKTALWTARIRGEIAAEQGLQITENPFGRPEFAQAWRNGWAARSERMVTGCRPTIDS